MCNSVLYLVSLIMLTSVFAASILGSDAKQKEQHHHEGYLVKEEGYTWKRTYYNADIMLPPETGMMDEPAVPSYLPSPSPSTFRIKLPGLSLFPRNPMIAAKVKPEPKKPSPSKTPVATSKSGSGSHFTTMSTKGNLNYREATKTPIPSKGSKASENATG